MSNEDPYRPNPGRGYDRDRGAYTPPTDDDLPFDRQGYDGRRGGGAPYNPRGAGRSGPPLTLIISGVVLLALIVAVALYYRAGPRASNDAPPAVGTPVGPMTVEAPVDAQPVDPEAGIDVYDDTVPPTTETPTYAPPPETVQPRPEPAPAPAPQTPAGRTPSARPDFARETGGAPIVRVRPNPPATYDEDPSPVPSGGNAAVQIGAFSTPSIAEREYNSVVGRYSRLTQGGQRRIQEVTTSSGATVYRTTVGGLSREQATGLCAAIRDAGGDCLVR